MDRIGAGDLRRADHGGHVQIAVGAARRTDADVLVGEADVQRILVRLGVDGDSFDAELAARDDDAHRDFAAVRYEDLLEHVTAMADGSWLMAYGRWKTVHRP